MPGQKRTRPRAVAERPKPVAAERPVRTDALLPLNAPSPGCCKPYPDARFVDQVMVELHAHHNGPSCKGYMEPLSIEEWNADVDAKSAANRSD